MSSWTRSTRSDQALQAEEKEEVKEEPLIIKSFSSSLPRTSALFRVSSPCRPSNLWASLVWNSWKDGLPLPRTYLEGLHILSKCRIDTQCPFCLTDERSLRTRWLRGKGTPSRSWRTMLPWHGKSILLFSIQRGKCCRWLSSWTYPKRICRTWESGL